MFSHWIILRMVSHYFLTLFERLSTVKEYASETKYTVFFSSDRRADDYYNDSSCSFDFPFYLFFRLFVLLCAPFIPEISCMEGKQQMI